MTMIFSRLLAAATLLVLVAPGPFMAPAEAGSALHARDLRADAREAGRRAVPILVMFNSHTCPYCELVMGHYIEPMAASRDYADKVIIRVVDVDGYRKLVDFAGETYNHSSFADKHNATLTPVIKFFDPRGGELTEQLLGFTNEHFYGYYLDAKIDESLARLRSLADSR